jgi:hypothetical protein
MQHCSMFGNLINKITAEQNHKYSFSILMYDVLRWTWSQ